MSTKDSKTALGPAPSTPAKADRTVYNKKGHGAEQREKIAALYDQLSGNVSAIARAMNLGRSAVRAHIQKMGKKKPLAGGTRSGVKEKKSDLPEKGGIKRYILTSAQNNTFVNRRVWDALRQLANHYGAEIFVGTFSYNMNAYGPLAVKYGSESTRGSGSYDKEPWFDPSFKGHINDERVELGKGLVWCGEMNILPTEENPLSGLETYTHRKSAIFPHAKMAMRSIATMQGEGTKFNYTTGTITLMNYIQKKAGLKAEHHHIYGGLLVEVDSEGHWWVRQVHVTKDGNLQDLDVKVEKGKLTTGNSVEAITWGDLHATIAEPWVVRQSQDMLDTLKPKYQFLHDVMEGVSTNRHVIKHAPDAHYGFYRWLRGLHRVDEEITRTIDVIRKYLRPWCKTVVPDSNHDGWWLRSWLLRYDYRYDPANAELFLKLQNWFYEQTRENVAKGLTHKEINVAEKAFDMYGLKKSEITFLLPDDSFTICNRRIECGMHGHLGPNGKFGTPELLSKIGRKANTAHTHSCGIYAGLYVAGTSSKLSWSYNEGPSSWSHSHIITYPNGNRTIVTFWAGKWRA